MLFILHEDRLKITKMNMYSIYFIYDNVRYFAKADGYSSDSCTRLYKKTIKDNGRYEIELITMVGNNQISDLNNYFRNNTGVYKQINKVGLIKEMIRGRLVDGAGKFKEAIKKDDLLIWQINERIRELKEEIMEIRWR